MEVHLEALLELIFCTQPPNFEVEAHIEAPTGVALTHVYETLRMRSIGFLRQDKQRKAGGTTAAVSSGTSLSCRPDARRAL
jgi:hypothetical protein